MAKTSNKLALFKSGAENQGELKNNEQKEAQMKEYKEREHSLNNGISTFLISMYGHNGDPPPKQKKVDLLMSIKKKTQKKIADGRPVKNLDVFKGQSQDASEDH